ncbi:MAG: OmpA family protein [Alistipes sp.]|jgi:outer membrane protein OmpA-like peptidoglycan-associated protein|nr:OmpA family protein [Alistipes sp.]
MKKITLTLCIALASLGIVSASGASGASAVGAQSAQAGVRVETQAAQNTQKDSRTVAATDIRITRSGTGVTVSFTLAAGRKATRATYDLVVTPVIRGVRGGNETRLPDVVVRGRRSKVIAMRHELAAGQRSGRGEQGSVQTMAPGTSLVYTATVPFAEWMVGGELALDGVSVGCCSSREVTLGPVADNILYAAPRVETRITEVPITVARTTGQQLASQYPFVASAAEFELLREALQNSDDQTIIDRVLTETRPGSISIYFDRSLREIDRTLGTNNENLVELIAAVRALTQATDARIAAIIIAGFASPEGSPELNRRLAHDRAVAVRDFLIENTDVSEDDVRIFNGGADWTGLRELVGRSELAQKQRITEIIDSVPASDPERNTGRHLAELQSLDGGQPYRYMMENLFPELRQAAYIKVYYENE